MKRPKTASVHPRISSSVLSDLPLPIPPPVIPDGYVPRYLRSTHSGQPREPSRDETLFSFVRIGDKSVINMQHQTRIPPRCHSRQMKRPAKCTHVLSAPCRCPRNTVPFSFNYFGESDSVMGCFSELVALELPSKGRQGSPVLIERPTRELPRIGFVPQPYGSHFAPVSSPRSSGMDD
jgi:hypothetical protein